MVRLADLDKARVGLAVVRDDQRRLVEREAARPLPGPVVDLQGGAEHAAPGAAEDAPGGDHVGGGIADANTAEVDDRAHPAVANQHVGPEQVAVDPHRRPRPRRCPEGTLPRRDGRVAIDDAPRRLDHLARDGVELAEGPAPTTRRPDGIDPAQVDHEPGEILGRPPLVVHQPVRIRLAVDPPVDRPGERVRAPRTPPPNRLGNPQRQPWGELREPAPLPVQVRCPLRHPRQPRTEPVAKPVDGVHRSRRPHLGDRQVRQVGKLFGHQPPDEAGIDVDLPVMHLHPWQSLIPGRPSGPGRWLPRASPPPAGVRSPGGGA